VFADELEVVSKKMFYGSEVEQIFTPKLTEINFCGLAKTKISKVNL
jgi:hypothetical protein